MAGVLDAPESRKNIPPDSPNSHEWVYSGSSPTDSLAAADRHSDGLLVVPGLCHVGDYLTVVTAEAGVCVIHSQFVVNQTWRIPVSAYTTFIP